MLFVDLACDGLIGKICEFLMYYFCEVARQLPLKIFICLDFIAKAEEVMEQGVWKFVGLVA
jgi:hypothetical protein